MNTLFSFVPKPFLFNPLKHHLGYINKYIGNYHDKDYSKLRSDLLVIGESQMDLYTGVLSTAEISRQILLLISNSLLINNSSYIKFIHESGGYYKTSLSDGSEWVLRRGRDPERYVHFHPARNSPFTVRIKANSLKTLIAAYSMHKNHVRLPEINQVRSEILQSEPFIQLIKDSGIGKHLDLFQSFSSITVKSPEIVAIN